MKTTFASIALALASLGASAAGGKVLLETPVTYHPDAGVADKVKAECHVEDLLAQRVGAALGRDGTLAAGAAAPADAAVVRLQITHVLGVGGGAWSGPKAITVQAELIENGKPSRATRINRWTSGGAFGGFKGTCSMLDRCAVAIGKDVKRWVQDPGYKAGDDTAPKEAAPEGAASAPQE